MNWPFKSQELNEFTEWIPVLFQLMSCHMFATIYPQNV